MTDNNAIIEAAARALFELDETAGLDNIDMDHIARAVLAAVTPLIEEAYVRSRATIHVAAIRAAALEEAAKVAEDYDLGGALASVSRDIAADIRDLKEQP